MHWSGYGVLIPIKEQKLESSGSESTNPDHGFFFNQPVEYKFKVLSWLVEKKPWPGLVLSGSSTFSISAKEILFQT